MILESLIPVMVIGNSHSLVTSSVKKEKSKAAERGETSEEEVKSDCCSEKKKSNSDSVKLLANSQPL